MKSIFHLKSKEMFNQLFLAKPLLQQLQEDSIILGLLTLSILLVAVGVVVILSIKKRQIRIDKEVGLFKSETQNKIGEVNEEMVRIATESNQAISGLNDILTKSLNEHMVKMLDLVETLPKRLVVKTGEEKLQQKYDRYLEEIDDRKGDTTDDAKS